jgi:ribonuclease P protein component
MLPAASRLRRRPDFAATIRGGRRISRPRLIVHVSVPTPPADAVSASYDAPPLAGFVVGRAVGGAVVRNRVRRRLRHLVAARLDQLPAGSRVVVRALPPAAQASFAELGGDLDGALRRVTSGGRP